MTGSGNKEEQSARTRQTLIVVARQFFGERGYAETGTEDIVQEAGVTRGALYHHFVDKRDLFEAVYIDLQDELRDRIVAAAGSAEVDSIWVRIHRGTHEYLDHYMDATVQRIVLIDAPSVLGWNRWRELDEDYALGLLRGALSQASEQGILAADADSDVLAHLMMGVISEASHVIAMAEDVTAARRAVGVEVDRILDSLRQPPRNEL
ncbi:MAG: TetR/AcrR family transcriptional regulator [Dehalococcoidia bacterium]|jgi:AcrR family transcriptional regulator|nr:TetR/AcrR family transcriptional regulator [Dehalococcoidia bacterium]